MRGQIENIAFTLYVVMIGLIVFIGLELVMHLWNTRPS
jgi:hypothetical protein